MDVRMPPAKISFATDTSYQFHKATATPATTPSTTTVNSEDVQCNSINRQQTVPDCNNRAAVNNSLNLSRSADVTDDGGNKPNIDLLKTSYDERLKTFKNRWTAPYPQPEALASACFYFTGYSDIVCCPYCQVEVGEWLADDDPFVDHLKWSPTCKFITMQSQGGNTLPQQDNIETASATATSSSGGHDTCGKYGIIQSSTSIPENSSVVGGNTDFKSISGIQQIKPASYKQFVILEKRIASFKDWPVSIAQKPKELAEAGFFYTGKSDQTVCFQCGGGLKDWENNDQPWQQHAKWFPQCPFVVLQKGMEYIKEQQQQKVVESKLAAEIPAAKVEDTKKEEDPLDAVSNQVMCKICYSKEVGVVFLPCGHMVACVNCAPVLETCAVCRMKIDAHVRAFLS